VISVKVKDIMTKNPTVIRPDTPIYEIAKIFERNKFWSVYVGEQNDFIGIITRNDLQYRGRSCSTSTPAYKIMSKGVISIDENADVKDAKNILSSKKINGIAVTRNGKHIGIVTQYDINTKKSQIREELSNHTIIKETTGISEPFNPPKETSRLIEMNKCTFCGKKIEHMPFQCWRCPGIFCPEHRLPEDHMCDGIYHWSNSKKPAPKPDPIPLQEHQQKIIQPKSQELQKHGSEPKRHHNNNLHDDIPRMKLCDILKDNDLAILEDSKRLRAILNDLCKGKYSREINAIIGALDEHVPQEMQKSQNQIPYTILSNQMSQKLLKNTYLSEDLIKWTIESWASALGISNVL
jgi:predicted transcriptional regulator